MPSAPWEQYWHPPFHETLKRGMVLDVQNAFSQPSPPSSLWIEHRMHLALQAATCTSPSIGQWLARTAAGVAPPETSRSASAENSMAHNASQSGFSRASRCSRTSELKPGQRIASQFSRTREVLAIRDAMRDGEDFRRVSWASMGKSEDVIMLPTPA